MEEEFFRSQEIDDLLNNYHDSILNIDFILDNSFPSDAQQEFFQQNQFQLQLDSNYDFINPFEQITEQKLIDNEKGLNLGYSIVNAKILKGDISKLERGSELQLNLPQKPISLFCSNRITLSPIGNPNIEIELNDRLTEAICNLTARERVIMDFQFTFHGHNEQPLIKITCYFLKSLLRKPIITNQQFRDLTQNDLRNLRYRCSDLKYILDDLLRLRLKTKNVIKFSFRSFYSSTKHKFNKKQTPASLLVQENLLQQQDEQLLKKLKPDEQHQPNLSTNNFNLFTSIDSSFKLVVDQETVPEFNEIKLQNYPSIQLTEYENSNPYKENSPQISQNLTPRNEQQTLSLFNQPKSLSTKMMHYQIEGLNFMLIREGRSSNTHLNQQLLKPVRTLHPAWKEYLIGEGAKSNPIYFDENTGQITQTEPLLCDNVQGGILADQMGLGKTLMAIALIMTDLHLFQQNDTDTTGWSDYEPSSTLIITKSSILQQWKEELAKHIDSSILNFDDSNPVRGKVNVCLYYGGDRKKFQQLKKFQIVLTTYQILMEDYKLRFNNEILEEVEKKKKKDQKVLQKLRDRQNFGLASGDFQDGIVFAHTWRRVILDEAHSIGNFNTKTFKAAMKLESRYRWCLTGTPLQNRLEELFSLFCFLRYAPWNNIEEFHDYFQRSQLSSQEQNLNSLLEVMRPIYLRRTKQSVDRTGRSIIETPLPEITVIEEKIQFSPEERQLYSTILSNEKKKLDNLVVKGKVPYMKILEGITRARQCCDHASLLSCKNKQVYAKDKIQQHIQQKVSETQNVPQIFEAANVEDQGAQEQLARKSKKQENYLQNLQEKILGGELENCQICYSEIEEIALTKCDQPHIFCRPCIQQVIQIQREKGRNHFFCPTCRTKLEFNDYEVFFDEVFQINEEIIQRKSTKIQSIVSKVAEILARGEEKIVIFSQFIKIQEMIGTYLLQDIPGLDSGAVLHLKSDQTLQGRQAIINRFQNDANTRVLISSIKISGVGLNLTAANNIILSEPWFNPAAEDQAIERVHRIGQQKPVFIYKFITRNSIEEQIINIIHKQKRFLMQHATNGQVLDSIKSLGVDNYKKLLQFEPEQDNLQESDSNQYY